MVTLKITVKYVNMFAFILTAAKLCPFEMAYSQINLCSFRMRYKIIIELLLSLQYVKDQTYNSNQYSQCSPEDGAAVL